LLLHLPQAAAEQSALVDAQERLNMQYLKSHISQRVATLLLPLLLLH
jgi:hypothetical protein